MIHLTQRTQKFPQRPQSGEAKTLRSSAGTFAPFTVSLPPLLIATLLRWGHPSVNFSFRV